MIKAGLLIGASAVMAMAVVPAAEAARCPSGQIYRVSKKTCMDKALAIKLGFIKPGKTKRSRAAVRSAVALPAVAAPIPPSRPEATGSGSASPVQPSVPAQAGEAAAKPVAGSRPEISPVPIRKVKPVFIRPTPGPDLAPGLAAVSRPAPSGPKAPPALVAKPVSLPLSVLEPKKPKFKAIPIARPVAAGASDAAAIDRLKDKLREHVEKNRGKLTKRALPGG